jgi:hypothetical protein
MGDLKLPFTFIEETAKIIQTYTMARPSHHETGYPMLRHLKLDG